MSINKNILYQIIQKHIKDTDILWLANKIIFHDPTTNYYYKGDKSLIKLLPNDKSLFYGQRHKGLPIGNLTSQFFANVYLNELDQFVKHELKAKFYLRYVDDFILLHENKQTLLYYKTQIDKFLKTNLDLELNQNKQVLQKTDKGIDWLGYYIKPYYTLSRKRVVKAFKKKLYEFNNEIDALLIDNSLSEKELPILLEKYLATINSYYGHFRHANCYRLRKTLYEAHFHTLKTYYAPKNKSYSSIIIKILFRK